MNDKPSQIDRYLKSLERGLDALGPDETRDVIAEFRGLLADALVDAGGDESAALARFGGPDALAARILEERGIPTAESRVPEASRTAQALALAADIALWLVAWMFLFAFMSTPVTSDRPGILTITLAWAAVGAAAAGSLWWWARRRRQPGHDSIGMQVMGLRRIRVGKTTRLVRRRDIPGLIGRRRFLPIIVAVLALLILASAAYSVGHDRRSMEKLQMDNAVSNAVSNASIGVGIVSDTYRQVTAGAPAAGLVGWFDPAARPALIALERRHALGKFASYSVSSVGVPGYRPEADDSNVAHEIVVLVDVDEFARGSQTPAVYRYRVSCIVKPIADGAAEGTWQVRSVRRVAR